MLTVKCTLRFKDGRHVTGSLVTEAPLDDVEVVYEGEVQRLPRAFSTTNAVILKALFGNLAGELSAALDVVESGEYESVAEY